MVTSQRSLTKGLNLVEIELRVRAPMEGAAAKSVNITRHTRGLPLHPWAMTLSWASGKCGCVLKEDICAGLSE